MKHDCISLLHKTLQNYLESCKYNPTKTTKISNTNQYDGIRFHEWPQPHHETTFSKKSGGERWHVHFN